MARVWIIRSILCAVTVWLPFSTHQSLAQGRMETGFLDRFIDFEGSRYHYQVYVPSSYTPTERWPVILFLHGMGEQGRDGLLQTQVGLAVAIRQHPSRYPAIVVFPQAPKDSLWVGTTAHMAMAALGKTVEEFQTDAGRVYLTGLSMGGNGTWYLAYRNPALFAAVVPVCGWVTPFKRQHQIVETVIPVAEKAPFDALAARLARVPIWIFHGEEDASVPVDESRQAAAALTAAGAAVQYTELPGVGHNSWDAAYGSLKFTTWLFQQKR